MSDVKTPPSERMHIPPPPGIPQPTGHWPTDVYNSLTHILQVPCAKNAFMQGILGGAGMGFIRGTTTTPFVAGHWAMASFVGISLLSWQLCHSRMREERARVIKMMENAPRVRKVKYEEEEE